MRGTTDLQNDLNKPMTCGFGSAKTVFLQICLQPLSCYFQERFKQSQALMSTSVACHNETTLTERFQAIFNKLRKWKTNARVNLTVLSLLCRRLIVGPIMRS